MRTLRSCGLASMLAAQAFLSRRELAGYSCGGERDQRLARPGEAPLRR